MHHHHDVGMPMWMCSEAYFAAFDLVDLASDAGLKLTISTNGTLITPEKAARLKAAEVAYVGDDLVDLSMMKRVGLPIAVGDAVEDVKKYAAYVTKARGGYGACAG